MVKPLRILHLEDDPADAELVRATLGQSGMTCDVVQVQNREDFLAALDNTALDLILADNKLPAFDGLSALALARQKCPHTPFIFVAGTMGEDVAVDTLKSGATDYVLKDRLSKLVPAVRRAIREAEEQRERRRAEDALENAVERFRRLVDSAVDAIVGVDGEGRITLVNPQAEKLFGYSPGELLGKPIEILVPERFREAHVGHRVGYCLAPRQRPIGVGLDLFGRRKDGSEFPVEISLSSMETGEGLFVTAIIRDITERKQAELNAREKQRLEDMLRFKSAFITNMSHELRTPLNSIIGFSELLEAQHFGALTEKQVRYVANIQSSGQHLLLLIDDILDLAKIEAGRIELQPEAFPLPEALRAALHMIRPQAVAKRLGLHLDVDACPKTVVADPTRFKQVLFNLLSNAVKFTGEKGKVTLSATVQRATSNVQRPKVQDARPWSVDDQAFVEISVADTGIGIKAEDIPKLFQEFTQLDGSLTRRYQGTGLGLALTKRFVEMHGGRIWVESAGEGRGSTFRFTLPLEGPPPGNAEPDSRISS